MKYYLADKYVYNSTEECYNNSQVLGVLMISIVDCSSLRYGPRPAVMLLFGRLLGIQTTFLNQKLWEGPSNLFLISFVFKAL